MLNIFDYYFKFVLKIVLFLVIEKSWIYLNLIYNYLEICFIFLKDYRKFKIED